MGNETDVKPTMELKTMESDVASLCTQYEYLRNALEEKQIKYDNVILALPLIDDKIISISESNINDSIIDNNNKDFDVSNIESLHASISTWKYKVLSLQEKADKFHKRLQEKDPITKATRHGEKTALRVKNLLSNYDELVRITNTSLTANDADDHIISIVKAIESIIQEQKIMQDKKQKEIEIKNQNELETAQQIQSIQKQKEEEERLIQIAQKEKEELELAKRAEELREARNKEIKRIKDNERNYINSILKGEKGIKIQLQKLKQSISDKVEYKIAIQSLHTVYSQILAYPEEIKYRKIRRDHPKFAQDIGRHDGGVELFIASGFTLENITVDNGGDDEYDNEISCLFSKEPDIEHDMERWTEWFDLLKLTLESLRKEKSNL